MAAASNEAAVLQVKQSLKLMLSPNLADVRNAESQVASLSASPGFVGIALTILSKPADTDETVLKAGAIVLKNVIRKNWDTAPEHGGLGEEDRNLVKGILLTCMLRAPAAVQPTLGVALELVAETDFPLEWPALLDELVKTHLTSPEREVQKGSMRVLHSVLKKYRSTTRCDDTLYELKMILEHLQLPLFEIFKLCLAALFDRQPPLANPELQSWLQMLLLSCKVFHSLNCVDLPEFYEDHMQEYFGGFAKLIQCRNHIWLADLETARLLEKIWAEVLSIFQLYSQRYCEQLDAVVGECCLAVLLLLEWAGEKQECRDRIARRGLGFLSSAALTLWKSNPFADDAYLYRVCLQVLPNIHLKAEDIEVMNDSPLDYVRRDVEGGDNETRRQAAVSLVNALCRHYSAKVSTIFSEHLTRTLSSFSGGLSSDQQDCQRDAAAELFTALSVDTQTRFRGVSSLRAGANVTEFFDSYLLPELVRVEVDQRTIAKIAALKFIVTFRVQFPQKKLEELIPVIQQHHRARNVALHTYAAHCLERILSVRVNIPTAANNAVTSEEQSAAANNLALAVFNPAYPWSYKIDKAVVKQALMDSLGLLIQSVKNPSESGENEFLMRCLMRIFFFLKEDSLPAVGPSISELLRIIILSSANPSNPAYSHYLFDTVALLTKLSASSGTLDASIESSILQTLAPILQQNMHDFAPYALQLLGLLLDAATTASPDYVQLYNRMLEAECWSASTANIPGIIRLLGAYFRKWTLFEETIAPSAVVLLERFQYCLYHKRLSTPAFDLLNDIFQFLPPTTYQPHFEMLLKVILGRIQQHKTDLLCRDAVVSLSFWACKNSTETGALVRTLEGIQPGLGKNFFEEIFCKTIKSNLKTFIAKKTCALALAYFSTSTEFLSDAELLNNCYARIVSIIEGEDYSYRRQNRAADALQRDGEAEALRVAADIDIGEEWQGKYNKLSAVNVVARDRLPQVTDIRTTIGACLMLPAVQQAASALPEYKRLLSLLTPSA